ncbi:MAG: hypothetical protein RL043_321 [Pseudomonadota bacterium]
MTTEMSGETEEGLAVMLTILLGSDPARPHAQIGFAL